jgi:hypothetical protein
MSCPRASLVLALLASACTIRTLDPPLDRQRPEGSVYGGCPPATGGAPGHSDWPRDAGAPPFDARLASACPITPVDRWKELLVIDGSVLGDDRARNDLAGAPWSFRQRLEGLAGEGGTDLAYRWLAQWSATFSVPLAAGRGDSPRVPIVPRPEIDRLLLCPWLRLAPSNGCTANCDVCARRQLDLAAAPFRLIAIVNRQDLGEQPCGRDGGELRLVYTAIDPDTRAARPFTVIFEYRLALPPGLDRRGWAAAWHALGQRSFGTEYNARLADLLATGLRGATLSRVRTNEAFLAPAWELREFAPVVGERGEPSLEGIAPAHTPPLALDDSPALGQWIASNAAAILAGQNPLPADMRAGAAALPAADFLWRAPGVDPALLAAFNRNSCNGCHGGRREPNDLPFQHLGAGDGARYYGPAMPTTRVSRFLNDPGHADELTRRGRALAEAACATCLPGYP